jgi:hypothetical protein
MDRRSRRSWVYLLAVTVLSGLALFILVQRGFRLSLADHYPVDLRSNLWADYSADPRDLPMAPLDHRIISDLIIAEAAARPHEEEVEATVTAIWSMPVVVVTPAATPADATLGPAPPAVTEEPAPTDPPPDHTATATAQPANTATATRTPDPTATPVPSPTQTNTPIPTSTPLPTPTPTSTSTPLPTPSFTLTATPPPPPTDEPPPTSPPARPTPTSAPPPPPPPTAPPFRPTPTAGP